MARLNTKVFNSDDEDEDLPELCTLLQRLGHCEESSKSTLAKVGEEERGGNQAVIADGNDGGGKPYSWGKRADGKSDHASSQDISPAVSPRKQRPLRLTHVNSLLLPISKTQTFQKDNDQDRLGNTAHSKSPTRRLVPRSRLEPFSTPPSSGSDAEEEFSDGLSDFIVNDSASECEEEPARKQNAWKDESRKDEKDERTGVPRIYVGPKGNEIDWTIPKKPGSGRTMQVAGKSLYKVCEEPLQLYECIRTEKLLTCLLTV